LLSGLHSLCAPVRRSRGPPQQFTVSQAERLCRAVRLMICTAGRRGRRGRQGPAGPTCKNPSRSAEWVCPVTKLYNGRRKPCDDYACECKVTAYCPKGQYVSSCLCSNTNPLTPVDLGSTMVADPMTGAAAASVQYGGGELDLRYPWVMTSNMNPMMIPAEGAHPNALSECTCTWVNTIPLVRPSSLAEILDCSTVIDVFSRLCYDYILILLSFCMIPALTCAVAPRADRRLSVLCESTS
jgi:hypothetical protein